MKIETLRVLNGANIYSERPVLLMHLDLEDVKDKLSLHIAGFNERVLELLPQLREHYCDAGKPGGFVNRMAAGTHFNHVIEHVAMELLASAGFDKRDKKVCGGSEKDDSKAVIETTAVETTRYLMPVAAELVDSVIKETSYNVEEKVIEAKEIAADTELGPSTMTIVEAAESRGIPWSRENEYSLVQLGYGRNLHQVQAAVSDRTSSIGAELAGNKDLTKQRLRKFSIPVPHGWVVRNEEEAVKAFEALGAPVVVKPLDGRQGKGVSLDISTTEEVVRAFNGAREYSSRVLVEELFEGKNYRVLVIDGKMVAASERLPCNVTGDGAHTLAELIEIENRNPLRGEGHEKPLTKIKINSIVLSALEKNGRKMDEIPPAGEKVMLCAAMNLSTGGTARDVTDEVHFSIKTMCERAARIVDLDICGVDLVVDDISAPVPTKNGGIIELNAAPGLRMHTRPSEGKARDAGKAIIEMLYPEGASPRIPIVTVTGTNGKTTVTRMISHLLLDGSRNVGTTTTDGIFFNGEQIVSGDTTGPISAKTMLGDKAVEVAVLETARGGIVRRGLGYDWSDVAVITNISEDHIGQDGIESIDDLINIKALIAERILPGGTLVLNADDETSDRILERPRVKERNARLIYFSLHERNPRVERHLERGGTAYFSKGRLIIEAVGNRQYAISEVGSIPATMNGAAEFQVANVMAAIAAARALGVSAAGIARLQSFRNDANNPGRNNLYRVGSGYALIDYGHNAGAFAAICRMAARWHGRCVTGIIGVPGDRDDRLIKEAARIAADGFDRIVIKEDLDLRGRRSGEVARLICETVGLESPGTKCDIVLDEVEAFETALRDMNEGEVVVLFYDKLEPVLDILAQYEAEPISAIKDVSAPAPREMLTV